MKSNCCVELFLKVYDMIEIKTFLMKTLLGKHKVKLINGAVELSNRLHRVRKQVLIAIDDDDADDDNDDTIC